MEILIPLLLIMIAAFVMRKLIYKASVTTDQSQGTLFIVDDKTDGVITYVEFNSPPEEFMSQDYILLRIESIEK